MLNLSDNARRQSNDQFISSSSGGTMTSAETTEQSLRRIAVLQTMSIEDITVFFYSKEGQAEVRDSIVIETDAIRAVAIIGFGKLLLLAWEYSSKCSIENVLRFSSLSEGIRTKEDFSDFACDVIKSMSLGVIAKAPASDPQQQLEDSPTCVRAYCEVLTDLFLEFNREIFGFDGIVSSVLGSSTDGSSTGPSSIRSSYNAISMLPLIKRAVAGLLGAGGHHLLIQRWRGVSWCYEFTRLLSQLFLSLLGEGTGTSILLDYTVLEKGTRGGYTDSGLETMESRGASGLSTMGTGVRTIVHAGVRVTQIAEEWVLGCLLQQAASTDIFEASAAVGEALSFSTAFSSSFSSVEPSSVKGEAIAQVM